MATESKTASGDFLNNLGKVYGIYAGGFLGFVILLAILEQLGLPDRVLGYLFVGFTILVYAVIGVLSRTAQVSEYYVAGRKVPAFYNGMATGADWMSAASFVGMAGTLYALGYDGLAFVLGWTGGYVLVSVLLAPFLRKFGAYTVPDFLAARYNGNLVRFLGVIVLAACSFTYVVAQIYGTGIIASRFLGLDFQIAVYAGLGGILLCSMLGGMRAVTWTQVAQYIVLIVAYLTPVVILSAKNYGIPIPQLTYGQALQDITAREQEIVAQGLNVANTLKPHITPFLTYDKLNYFALILCLMVGTASLPHILMRYFTTPSVRDARKSVAWSLFFIFLLYFTAPSYAAFAKLEVYTNVIGQSLDQLPAWISTYSNLGLVKIYGVTLQGLAGTIGAVKAAIAAGAADMASVAATLQSKGLTSELAAWSANVDPVKAVVFDAVKANAAITAQEIFNPAIHAASTAAGNTSGLLGHSGLSIDNDVIVLSTPEIAGMPYVIAGLVAAGGLAAALSTADGLLLAIANALSHDVYYKMIDTHAPTARRLVVARILLFGVAVAAAYTASTRPADILAMVSWAFSLAAAGLFPALVLGVWWKRANKWGAIAGIIAGFGICVYYLVGTRYYAVGFYEMWSGLSGASEAAVTKFNDLKAAFEGAAPEAKAAAWKALDTHAQAIANWFGVRNISSALFGLPAGFIAMIVVSLLTAAPSKQMQDFIDEIRRPKGKELMEGGNLVREVH
ncbi:sodium:solute symporter family protein [Taklimakanibacter lacteus]|uniref:sodium:solute symporter family protein n=1 Tax=Taklimakanibacter lacteus TaxID=2268456 RepID=UPI000E667CBC